MSKENVIEKLKILLADTYALYLKTQNYHWNVEGVNFKPLHLLFEEQYSDLTIAVDDIAERIRTLGEKAPGTFSAYNSMKTIEDGNENADAATMVKELSADQENIIKSLKNVLDVAQEIGDEVTIGMVVDRIAIHEKNGWMLRSSV